MMPHTLLRNGSVVLEYVPGEPWRVRGLRRRELGWVLDTIGGLSILDGVRGIGGADVVRQGREVGRLRVCLDTGGVVGG